MKTAYELAMERLSKASPSVTLTPAQKGRIAELESEYKARLADKELALKAQMAKFAEAGDADNYSQLERQLVIDRRKLQEELEARKEQIRQGKT
jgi:hypothetical protein